MIDALDLEYFEKEFAQLEQEGKSFLVERLRALLPSMHDDGAQLALLDSHLVLPVTDAHVREAWNVFYHTHDYEPVPPRDSYGDRLLLAQFRRVLEHDRQFVARELGRMLDVARQIATTDEGVAP